MSACGCKADAPNSRSDVHTWHLADVHLGACTTGDCRSRHQCRPADNGGDCFGLQNSMIKPQLGQEKPSHGPASRNDWSLVISVLHTGHLCASELWSLSSTAPSLWILVSRSPGFSEPKRQAQRADRSDVSFGRTHRRLNG